MQLEAPLTLILSPLRAGRGELERTGLGFQFGDPARDAHRRFPPPFRKGYVFSVVVGTARCAVPARVVAGGTNDRAALAFERVAPLHAARTSQRDVPTTLNTY